MISLNVEQCEKKLRPIMGVRSAVDHKINIHATELLIGRKKNPNCHNHKFIAVRLCVSFDRLFGATECAAQMFAKQVEKTFHRRVPDSSPKQRSALLFPKDAIIREFRYHEHKPSKP